MSLVKLLPPWLHAIADYAVGALLILVALFAGQSGLAKATGVVVGVVVLLVSMVTRYPLGVVKLISFRLHSLGDYTAAALLIGSPFALGFAGEQRPLTAFYIGAGLAVLGVSLITNYQYAPDAWTSAIPLTPAAIPGPRRERPLRAASR